MAKKISLYGIFIATAIIAGYIDTLIPIPIPVPGIKLGLANVVTVTILYFMGFRSSFFISLIRIIISGILFSGAFAILYSFSGCVFSILSMNYFRRKKYFSIIGVSVIGSLMHNIGQILMACLILQNINIIIYFLPLSISAVITGTIIGTVSKRTLLYLQNL